MDTPPKLTDLPNELLGLIIEYLDSDSLFWLSMTCKVLHYVALPAFFEQNEVKEPASGWVVVHKAPRKTLQALRMALFVANLDQIYYYFNHGLDRLLGEVRDLHGLVARLPSVDQVRLRFSVFDRWLDRSPPTDERLDVDVWRKEFGSMLDQFLVKGCKKLHITGGSRIWTIYRYPRETMKRSMPLATDVKQQRSRLASSLQLLKAREEKLASRTFFGALRRKFTSLFSNVVPAKTPLQATTPLEEPAKPPPSVTAIPQPVSSDPGVKPSLHEFYVHCEMLLQTPFLGWTLSTLQLNGECITALSFKCIGILSVTWTDFFAALTFPSLSEFEITSDLFVLPQGPEFPCIESFLTRHPSITLLHLRGLFIPSTFPPAQESILPNLVKLTAHPAYVNWLLSSPNSLPSLGSITISSEYLLTPPFDYAHFDDALVSIAQNAGQVELGIGFSSEKVADDWLQDHVNIGCQVSTVSQLTEIKILAIRSYWFVEFSERILEILPEFLALFPRLEHVRFMEQPEENEQAMSAGGFVKAIVLRCPHVKTVLINRLLLPRLCE
jgi:hypothetical protein